MPAKLKPPPFVLLLSGDCDGFVGGGDEVAVEGFAGAVGVVADAWRSRKSKRGPAGDAELRPVDVVAATAAALSDGTIATMPSWCLTRTRSCTV